MKVRDMSVQQYIDWDLRRREICREAQDYDIFLMSCRRGATDFEAALVKSAIDRQCRSDLGIHDPSLRASAVY